MPAIIAAAIRNATNAAAAIPATSVRPHPDEALTPQKDALSSTPADSVNDIDMRVAVLAQTHQLTGRETEILGYLARGRSQPYIRDELVLSKNTVASHVKHIYAKLGVHSKQEVLDLFE